MKKILLAAAAAVVTLMLAFPDNAASYIRSSMDICCEMIIPTLFPFFICSGILISSGFCDALARLFSFCMRPLFGVAPAGAAAFVLGIISGYPLGAVTAAQLYEQGHLTKTEAERLCAFCSNSGPLFVIGSVGAAVYGDIRLGVMLYVIHILAAVSVGIIFRFYKHSENGAGIIRQIPDERSAGEIIGASISNAVNTMLTVCGAVVFFGMAGRLILDLLPLDGALYALSAGVIEFVTGTVSTAGLDLDTGAKLVMTAFIVGFAGLSVHAQVTAVIAGHGFSLVPYFAGKLLHGLLAALYTVLYLWMFPLSQAVFAPDMGRAFCASASCMSIASVTLICSGAAALICRIRRIILRGVRE